jgi:hypothetical protein
MQKADSISRTMLIVAIVLAATSFATAAVWQESWEKSKVGEYIPDDTMNCVINGDMGKWITAATIDGQPPVDDEPYCGPIPHHVAIEKVGSDKVLKMISGESTEGCADNLWVVLFTKLGSPINNNINIPINSGVSISFEIAGVLDNPEKEGWGDNCLVPPCYDNISLKVEDTHGNVITYVLDRYPSAIPNDSKDYYREILLDASVGTYSRNLYDDFSTIPNFTSGSSIYSIDIAIDEHGWCAISNIAISTSGSMPLSPTNLSASDGDYTDRVKVTWTASSGATDYEIWRNTSNNSAAASKIANDNTSPYDDTSAVAGTTYWYWVKAKNAAGTSGFSNSDSGYKTIASPPQTNFGNLSGNTNTKLIFSDSCGVPVTFTLTGGGYGEISGDANDQITLYDTTEKSMLTISTKSKTYTSIGGIICSGPMKGITAKTAKLSGSIEIGSPTIPNPKAAVTIAFDQVADLTIDSQMPIKSLTATEWLGGAINAPSVGSITTKGDKKRSITGNMDVDVEVDGGIGTVKVAGELSGEWNCNTVKSITTLDIDNFNLSLSQSPDTAGKILALGALTAKGYFYGSSIQSAGNIGTVTAGIMKDSSCFAGVAEGISGLPTAEAASFPEAATIKSIAIKGIKGESSPFFVNSNIAAFNILSVSIVYPQSDNDGVPFGLTADNIKKLTIKKMDGTTLKDSTNSWTLNNLEIRLLPE